VASTRAEPSRLALAEYPASFSALGGRRASMIIYCYDYPVLSVQPSRRTPTSTLGLV
jgi:hypothetical protein